MPGPTSTTEKGLSERHRRMLEVESCIAPEVIAARGYWTAETVADLEGVNGVNQNQYYAPALVLPIYGVDGEYRYSRVRPDNPLPNQGKYIQPADTPNVLDIPRTVQSKVLDSDYGLVVVEGERKGDALASLDIPVLVAIATLVALIRIYRYVRQQSGYSGWTTVGFYLVATSIAVLIANSVYELTSTPYLLFFGWAPRSWMIPLVVILDIVAPAIGYVLLGITSLRARLLPGWGNVAWFIGVIGAFALLIPGYFMSSLGDIWLLPYLAYGLMWLALGYALWANRSVLADTN